MNSTCPNDFLRSKNWNFDSLIEVGEVGEYAYIYLTPKNLSWVIKNHTATTKYRVDGMFMTFILNRLFPLCYKRLPQSFDFSSYAGEILRLFSEAEMKIGLVGGSLADAVTFRERVRDRYPGLQVTVICDGYESEDEIISKCSKANLSVYLLGLGSIKQERCAIELNARLKKPVFTCGGFISQTAAGDGLQFYPDWVSRLNVRWAYRFIKEPRTVGRVMIYYFPALCRLIFIALDYRFKKWR